MTLSKTAPTITKIIYKPPSQILLIPSSALCPCRMPSFSLHISWLAASSGVPWWVTKYEEHMLYLWFMLEISFWTLSSLKSYVRSINLFLFWRKKKLSNEDLTYLRTSCSLHTTMGIRSNTVGYTMYLSIGKTRHTQKKWFHCLTSLSSPISFSTAVMKRSTAVLSSGNPVPLNFLKSWNIYNWETTIGNNLCFHHIKCRQISNLVLFMKRSW